MLGTRLSWLFALLIACGLSGCVSTYYPLASHTLSTGQTDVDVVWLRRDADVIYRCMPTTQGPVCLQARVQ